MFMGWRRLEDMYIDSTTVTQSSNVIRKGVARHPKTGKKKDGFNLATFVTYGYPTARYLDTSSLQE